MTAMKPMVTQGVVFDPWGLVASPWRGRCRESARRSPLTPWLMKAGLRVASRWVAGALGLTGAAITDRLRTDR